MSGDKAMSAPRERRVRNEAFEGEDQRGRREREPVIAVSSQDLRRFTKIWTVVALIISGGTTVGVLNNPLQTKAAAAEAQAKSDARDERQDADIRALTAGMSDIRTDVKEGKELALMERLAKIKDSLARAQPGTEVYNDYLAQQTELAQRLTKVRKELGR